MFDCEWQMEKCYWSSQSHRKRLDLLLKRHKALKLSSNLFKKIQSFISLAENKMWRMSKVFFFFFFNWTSELQFPFYIYECLMFLLRAGGKWSSDSCSIKRMLFTLERFFQLLSVWDKDSMGVRRLNAVKCLWKHSRCDSVFVSWHAKHLWWNR